MTDLYKKSGYLNSEFKIFYLTESTSAKIDYHYHDFHKLLIFQRQRCLLRGRPGI